MTEDDQGFDYETGGDDDLSIHRIAAPGKRSGTIGPRPDHVVFWLADGRASLTADDGERWEVGAEQPMMLSASVAYGFETDATATTLLHLSPSLLGDTGESSVFQQPDAADPALEPLRALLREASGRVLDPALPADDRAALNRRIATVVLSTFARSRSDVADRMRRAIGFVHDKGAPAGTPSLCHRPAGGPRHGVSDRPAAPRVAPGAPGACSRRGDGQRQGHDGAAHPALA
ncbi:hypothetical protein [Curtobacterium sp. ME12]|uniref:hypothetical protein n=1 Tax=Curtobacterium sp. ME12 TaxID=2744253 RepID=UPI0015F4FD47|nr:hypothetical protein [Curtobacterium sp. ME12]